MLLLDARWPHRSVRGTFDRQDIDTFSISGHASDQTFIVPQIIYTLSHSTLRNKSTAVWPGLAIELFPVDSCSLRLRSLHSINGK